MQEEVEVPAVEETCTTKPVDECKEEEVIVIVIVIVIAFVVLFLMDRIVKDILKNSQVNAEEEREESQCDTVRFFFFKCDTLVRFSKQKPIPL